jgi:hypothetical protein
MSELKNLPFIYLKSRNGDGYPRIPPPPKSLQEDTETQHPEELSLKVAFKQGKAIQSKEEAALAAKLKELYELSTEPKETNELFLKSLRNTLQKNTLSLRESSKLSPNNLSIRTINDDDDERKTTFLNNLKKAHSLGLLKVIPDQQKESDIESSIFTSGEIKLHHSIDPSYSSTNRVRSRLYFMLMNNENSQLKSEPVLRIFSDEGNRRNPFYHLNIEFTDALPQNKISINSLFRNEGTASNLSIEKFNGLINYFADEGLPDKIDHLPAEVRNYYQNSQALKDSNNPEIRRQLDEESQNEHNRLAKLFQAENHILEYLSEHKLGKAASARDNLNLLKSISELLSAQKSKPIARSGQIESGKAFDGKPFYKHKLFNTSQKPLDFHTGFISTENLKIEFLVFDNKKEGAISKLNLKLTDKIRDYSTKFLVDAEAEKNPDLKSLFKEYLDTFLSFVQKKESKLIAPNSAQLREPNPPKT